MTKHAKTADHGYLIADLSLGTCEVKRDLSVLGSKGLLASKILDRTIAATTSSISLSLLSRGSLIELRMVRLVVLRVMMVGL